jgi:hypothetical protein
MIGAATSTRLTPFAPFAKPGPAGRDRGNRVRASSALGAESSLDVGRGGAVPCLGCQHELFIGCSWWRTVGLKTVGDSIGSYESLE